MSGSTNGALSSPQPSPANDGARPRVLLFTGKGGVGKTTTAAATAVEAAARGHRVVVTSADPAHSLGDVFATEVNSEPTRVAQRCDAQQLDALARMEASWGDIRAWMVEMLDWAGLSAVESEELALLPGFEELVALMEIDSLATSGDYDVIVVDCAPTAETIRLLSLPDVLDWYIRHLFPASRRLTRIARPLLSRVSDVPVAPVEVFDSFERFHAQLVRVRKLLTDSSTTLARIVVTPERMVLSEAQRTLTYLSLFGYRVDAVVVNRLLPAISGGGGSEGGANSDDGANGDDDGDDFFSRMRQAQQGQLSDIRDTFGPLRILRSELAATEILGVDLLASHGKTMWDGIDPLSELSPAAGLRMEHDGEGARLRIPMPSVESTEVDLLESDGELVITVGSYRRNLALPTSLRSRPVNA
ncbi:MAG: ArsA family ATPase, partial [Microthrixaceae bacterium]